MAIPGELTAIDAALVFDGEAFLPEYSVVISGKTIHSVVPTRQRPDGLATIRLEDGILAPGFIDLQVNGGGGVLLNNCPDLDGIDRIAAAHRRFGTTALLPTVMSDTRDRMRAAVAAVSDARRYGHPGILGVHIEGPFFEPARRGAHRSEYIRALEDEDLDWLCALADLPVMLTLAPEHLTAEAGGRLSHSGIILCAGHTNASGDEMNGAADRGLRGVTHLFNAMSQTTAREPGTVGAALADDRLWVSVIADGHHVHPDNVRTAFRAKPPGNMVLVSDAMASVGSEDGSFELYGETLRASGGRLVNGDGVLAGSAIGLVDAVRFATEVVGIELGDSLRMASRYPAAILGLDDTLGRVAPEYRADLVHFDAGYRVRHTWCAGEHAAHA